MFSFFQNQPEEIKIEIFRYLNELERAKLLPKVCKDWYRINKKLEPVPKDQERLSISRDMVSAVSRLWHTSGSPDEIATLHQKCITEIRAFLAKGGDPNVTNESFKEDFVQTACSKSSLLHGVTFLKSLPLAKMLVAKGAKVNYKNAYGQTPLHFAAQNNISDIAHLFINNNADVTIKDNENKTAADLARIIGNDSLAEAIETNSNWELLSASEHHISDDEMSTGSFGQQSNTARNMYFK